MSNYAQILVDTHCHINMIIKKEFDIPLDPILYPQAQSIISQAAQHNVQYIINVGTSLVESKNCIALAQQFKDLYATIGIHPNDCTNSWNNDIKELKTLLNNKESYKIVGIGEIGIDKHYPDYNLTRQQDAFKAQIELALEHNLGLVIHSRDASEETLRILDEYTNDIKQCVMHCFSYDTSIAQEVITREFLLGIGGTITYPKNNELRTIVQNTPLEHIVLETDAPFLPPQIIRGKQNHPLYIKTIAEYIAQLRNESLDDVARITTENALSLFNIPSDR